MIIAVDFDGCLCEDKYPEIGKPNKSLIQWLEGARCIYDYKIILWTCRTGKYLKDAVKWCKIQGLTFDKINDDVNEIKKLYPKTGNRKIFADIYIDEKAINQSINKKGDCYEKTINEAFESAENESEKRRIKRNAKKTIRNK